MFKKALLLLFGIALAITASAQTIQWLVKPTYDSICHLSGSVFMCKEKNKVQLINTHGQKLLAHPADSVTHVKDGQALVLDKTSNKLKIRGIINEEGGFTQVNGEYFANQYSYFSEKLISVAGLSGKMGYLNDKGTLSIPCQYRIARPFIKGWASVEPAKRKKQTIYIDKHRNTLKINAFHNNKVIMGSSFNASGEALIAYYDGDNAVINTQGKVVKKYNRKENIIPIRTYDFAFDESGQNLHPDLFFKPPFDPEISVFSSQGVSGHKKGVSIVTPPQFDWAGQFANGCAIVRQNNKYGIVKLVEGRFSGSFEGEDLLVVKGKEPPTYTYTLEIPDSYSLYDIRVMFDTGDGNMQPVTMHGNTYEFTPFVEQDAEFCVMRMKVMHDGLLLWADSLEKSVMNIGLNISQPIALSEKANEQDSLQVKSVITNNSKSSVFVEGSFSITFAKGSANKVGQKDFKGKIAPKGKLEVFAHLYIQETETAKVTVTVKVNKRTVGSKSANILVKPFYQYY